MGDIYEECEKNGCDKSFCESFETRMRLFPLRQTQLFLNSRFKKDQKINQWKIYLLAFIKLRPNDEKTDERKAALKLLE